MTEVEPVTGGRGSRVTMDYPSGRRLTLDIPNVAAVAATQEGMDLAGEWGREEPWRITTAPLA